MPRASGKDLVEVFGFAPDDITATARSFWDSAACPFVHSNCTKYNHDQTITYGTCSVTNGNEDIIICPNRLYAQDYRVIREVSRDAFGDVPFVMFPEYIRQRTTLQKCVVALGKNSGKEVQVGGRGGMSMDWVLALMDNGVLTEYVGLEVQSIDITGNYRDNWQAYKDIRHHTGTIPNAEHGLNWANVHKRLIPQLIRKGNVYSRSRYVKHGLYFVVPDAVYRKFEEIIGDIPYVEEATPDTLTVHTYEIGPVVQHGQHRDLVAVRKFRFLLRDFALRFIEGSTLPLGDEMDDALRAILNK